MSKALDLVAEGKMEINRAALEYGVPHTILKDRITRRVAPGCRVGKKLYLEELLSRVEVPGTLYGMSPNGWMDQELFSSWFFTHFLKPER